MILNKSQMQKLMSSESPLVHKKSNGGYRITDLPITQEMPNASLHIDKFGNVKTAHNVDEVQRILRQIHII